jgi:hypothetical protein
MSAIMADVMTDLPLPDLSAIETDEDAATFVADLAWSLLYEPRLQRGSRAAFSSRDEVLAWLRNLWRLDGYAAGDVADLRERKAANE